MTCREFGEEFELGDTLHYVYHSNATYVWCPVCLSHGKRSIHLITESWVPAFERETTAGGTAVVV